MGLRRTSRENAIRVLYSMEFTAAGAEEALENYWASGKGSTRLKEHTGTLVRGVRERLEEIDSLVNAASVNWPTNRMPHIDRNIIRLAVYELLACDDVPTAVVINEAVELAKEYAGEESASFINGVLGKIQGDVRKGNAV